MRLTDFGSTSPTPTPRPRKRTLRRKLVTTTMAMAAVLSLAACAAAPTLPPPLDRNSLETTTAPGKPGLDSVTWNLPYEPMSIDPMLSFNYAENTVIANMCESLLRMNEDLSTSPGLATKVETPNDTTFVYTIRQGVKFWDGKPLTAEDVAYSIGRQAGAQSPSYWATYFLNVKSVEATGPDEVTVRMKAPDALFPQAMASAAGAIVEKAAAEKGGQKFGTPRGGLQCTGPFAFADWKPGRALTLERNDSYWDSSLRPKIKQLDFSFIPDEATAVNALKSGDVDGQYFYLPPAGLGQLQDSKTVDVSLGKSFVFLTIMGVAKKGPYADPRIRRAISLAIDRDAISRVILQGSAIGAPTLAGPDYFGTEASVFEPAYKKFKASGDLAEAKRLVKEVGPIDKPIVFGVQGSSAVHEQTASVIQAAAASIGLPVKIEVIPVEQYGNLYSDPKASADLDGFFSTYYGNMADPLDVYSIFRHGTTQNRSDWGGAQDVLDQAMSTLDPEKRAELTVKAQDVITEQAPWIPLAYLPTILAQDKKITGATASIAYLYYPWAAKIGKAE